MFPKSDFNGLFFPMTAEVYYSTQSQTEFGEIIRAWSLDRVISCSAIKQNPDSKVPKFLDPEKYIEYDLAVNFRTNDNVQKAINEKFYKINDIIIGNIKDSSGNFVWQEDYLTGTYFEIRSIEPMLSFLSIVESYRIYLVRADNQEII